jgi:hypothetical protein
MRRRLDIAMSLIGDPPDTTTARGPVTIWLTVDEDNLSAATARGPRAAMKQAAATLDQITSSGEL